MKKKVMKKRKTALLLALVMGLVTACGTKDPERGAERAEEAAETGMEGYGSFAEAHDAFSTTLVREEHDDDPIPEPPEGAFDLVSYPSSVGDLAAYVSSDPGDGGKHPLIIWVVGGWGNGIDDFPWTYPAWDNDQTGSAFWREGILTMYPSFRGGNGNPGYYETLFGEVDDIVSAYEYAASLPYVDPERIYLGGHSTGGTRALLAAEYTDKFRAVFCFGAVDEIAYHNQSQFTFDLDDEEERIMRSPIYWLDDIESPTFLIEGRDGNSENLERMEEASQNHNLHCYVVEGADHFSVLAPCTRLVAKKIAADTGAEPAVNITPKELEQAMGEEPPVMLPVMTARHIEEMGLTLPCPYSWEIEMEEDVAGFSMYSPYEDDNAWDSTVIYVGVYDGEEAETLSEMQKNLEDEGYVVREAQIDGRAAIDAVALTTEDEYGNTYFQRYVSIDNGGYYVDFNCIGPEAYLDEIDELSREIINGTTFDGIQTE